MLRLLSKSLFTTQLLLIASLTSKPLMAESAALNLDLRVGDLDSVLADSLTDRSNLSISVTSDLDLTEEVNASLVEAARSSLRDPSVLDQEGNYLFSLETGPVLSIVVPPSVLAQVEVFVNDPNDYIRGIQLTNLKGEVPEGLSSSNTVDPTAASKLLFTQIGEGAFISSMRIDLAIPPTAAPQAESIEISYTIKSVI